MRQKGLIFIGCLIVSFLVRADEPYTVAQVFSSPLHLDPRTAIDKLAFKINSAADSSWWCRFTGVSTPHWNKPRGGGLPPSDASYLHWELVGISFLMNPPDKSQKLSSSSIKPAGAFFSVAGVEPFTPDYSGKVAYFFPLDENAASQQEWSQEGDVVNVKIKYQGVKLTSEFGGKMDLKDGTYIGTFRTPSPAPEQPTYEGNFKCDFLGYSKE